MYIFPNYPILSNLACIGIGIGILLIDDGKLWELQEEDPHKEKIWMMKKETNFKFFKKLHAKVFKKNT